MGVWWRAFVPLLSLALALVPGPGRTQAAGLIDVATMPSGAAMDFDPLAGVVRMVVDHTLDIGITIGSVVEDGVSVGQRLIMYDLARLQIAGKYELPPIGEPVGEQASVDPIGHRVFFPPGDPGFGATGCASGLPAEALGITVFEIQSREWSSVPMPCSGADQFRALAVHYHASSNKLYALGALQTERSARQLGLLHDQYAQTNLLRQVDMASGALDWEVDIRSGGCDRLDPVGNFGPFVSRHGDNVLAYCYGPATSSRGAQGFVVRIPLVGAMHTTQAGVPVIRSTPTLPNDLFPILDPGSGRMLLLTADAANGRAVWVYDPVEDRFAGVIGSGAETRDDPADTVYGGLDPVTGRTYLLTSVKPPATGGLLVADARNSPLPGGLSFPLLTDLREKNKNKGLYIGVSSKSHRLFIPVKGRGFAVIEDNVPPAPPPPPVNHDRGTANIPEVAGRTGRVYSGAGGAYGAHVLITGGLPRVADNADPSCYTFIRSSVEDSQGRCFADQFITPGHRELFLAPARVELGSETGAAGEAAGGAFSTKDTATDADFKRLGACEADAYSERTGEETPEGYGDLCDATPLTGFRFGTRGENGSGYPIPGSACQDFGGAAGGETQRPGAEGLPEGAVGSSLVACDFGAQHVEAQAGSALTALTANFFSVARTTATVTTDLTPGGVLTVARASASGIQIGDFSIGRIETEAITRAKGQAGSTQADFTRTIFEVHGPGLDCRVCDWNQVIDALNSSLGVRIRASVPSAFELPSPLGYQGLVLKDPATRDSEQAVNDDDSFEVPGLQVVFYNDGAEGRSRLVVKLAGVLGESRYGIFLLPEEREGSTAPLPVDTGIGTSVLGEVFTRESPGALQQVLDTITKAVTYPPVAATEAIRLVLTNPRQFALLFVMWTVLGSPLYLALRRRALGRGAI